MTAKVYFVDLHTYEKKLLFVDEATQAWSLLTAYGTDNELMYSISNSKTNMDEIYHVSLDTMEQTKIGGNARYPVEAGGKWFCLLLDEEQTIHVAQIVNNEIVPITIEGKYLDPDELVKMDDENLLIATNGWGTGKNDVHIYKLNVKTLEVECLLDLDLPITVEMLTCNGRYLSWIGGYTRAPAPVGLRANLYDMETQTYYPLNTNFGFLNSSGFAYRKMILDNGEYEKGYANTYGVSEIAYFDLQ